MLTINQSTDQEAGSGPLTDDKGDLQSQNFGASNQCVENSTQPTRSGAMGPMGDRAKKEDCCVICFQGEFQSTNEIVYCDACDLGFHQQCYGLPTVPEGDFFCDFCAIARDISNTDKRIAPMCELCHQKGGGLLRMWIVDRGEGQYSDEDYVRDGSEDEDNDCGSTLEVAACIRPSDKANAFASISTSLPNPLAEPLFVHKVCALAGWNQQPRLVRFVAGTNAQVAVVSRDIVATYRNLKAQEETMASRWQAADALSCGICDSSVGLLVRCCHHDPDSAVFRCSFSAHAACAFNAAQASLLLHDVQRSPLVTVWCSAHRPEPSVERPGGDAVAKCLGFLLPPLASPLDQHEQDGRQYQPCHTPLLRHLVHERRKEGYGRLGGYLDDKLRLLERRMSLAGALPVPTHSTDGRLILCAAGRAEEMFACRQRLPATPEVRR